MTLYHNYSLSGYNKTINNKEITWIEILYLSKIYSVDEVSDILKILSHSDTVPSSEKANKLLKSNNIINQIYTLCNFHVTIECANRHNNLFLY